jgi:hypothetical protein
LLQDRQQLLTGRVRGRCYPSANFRVFQFTMRQSPFVQHCGAGISGSNHVHAPASVHTTTLFDCSNSDIPTRRLASPNTFADAVAAMHGSGTTCLEFKRLPRCPNGWSWLDTAAVPAVPWLL